MQGGLKVYTGAPAAARHYVEADRGRVDDYYLAEGTGVARRFTATDGRVAELAPLSGNAYETWVTGRDPESGESRGRLRTDARAVRFVEVVVNGPKSWSLAAVLHPDIAGAYDAAQDRAAAQILGWLAQHATTRVGPAGGQVQVLVEQLEGVTVAHYTSRAGDPHRHLHLQINARVFAAGKWRGLHTVGIRDSLAAINGIGHAAMACDPELNAAFAAHGYTLDATGQILELAEYVGPMSARNQQIAGNADRYEWEWTQAHSGEMPGPALRRSWDARAWAQDRPDKVTPQPGADLTERWRTQLHTLGYRQPAGTVALTAAPIGSLDRDAVVDRALTRLAAARSAWNAADIRGEVERLIAADGIVADAPVRIELAEDLAARAMARCVPLLQRGGVPVAVPEHIRALSSRPVLDVEADLSTRLAARAETDRPDTDQAFRRNRPTPPVLSAAAARRLDVGQAAAVAALAGNRALVVIEGAAGAGKTTTLAATRAMVALSGHRLMVVTPTLKAATVARAEVGAASGSAAWLAYQHGWRWTSEGTWTRLAVGDANPATGTIYAGPGEGAQLRPGDLLVVDEAGMLDQDTARALLTVADECQVRVALLGDRHQLPAVGRGGVLDLAAKAVNPACHLTLDGVHRFTRTDPSGPTTPDTEYADLTLAMRTGSDAGAVFDALVTRGQIRLHADPVALREALAGIAANAYLGGERPLIVADTRECVADLNAAIRGARVLAGMVDDTSVVVTAAGQRIGVGDRVATRRNDRDLDVANRDTWLVTALGRHGELAVIPADQAGGDVRGVVTPDHRGERVLTADYVTAHVELAYARTAYGVQGDTVATAHVVVGESTGAAAAYVGMTRGRQANSAHLIAADIPEAREQWIAAFARDRADLGPAHAAQLAAAEAARYAPPRPLEAVLAELRAAWTVEQQFLKRLALLQPQRDTLREVVAAEASHAGELLRLAAVSEQTAVAAEQADQRAMASAAAIADHADQVREGLLAAWDRDRDAAREAARVVHDGPGRLGLRRAALARAGEQLTDWADRWRTHLSTLPTEPTELARVASLFDDRPALWEAFIGSGHRAAEQAHPDHARLADEARATQGAHEQAQRALIQARCDRDDRLRPFGPVAWAPDPAGRLADLDRDMATTAQQLTDMRARIAALTADPALLGQPPDRLTRERDTWRAQQAAEQLARQQAAQRAATSQPAVRAPRSEDFRYLGARHTPGRGIGR